MVKIRQAREADARGIADIHVRSWQAAYRGILADEVLEGLSVSEREASWRALLGAADGLWLNLVAEHDRDDLAGFCSVATPSREEGVTESTAEVGALYVAPHHWRQGAGVALLTTALEELSARHYRDVILWVLPENRAALAFYDRFGFEIEEGREKREARSGHRVIRLRVSLRSTFKFARDGARLSDNKPV
jgi:ribosomal protein S18 acetylase RimI-like enzyme